MFAKLLLPQFCCLFVVPFSLAIRCYVGDHSDGFIIRNCPQSIFCEREDVVERGRNYTEDADCDTRDCRVPGVTTEYHSDKTEYWLCCNTDVCNEPYGAAHRIHEHYPYLLVFILFLKLV